MNLRVAYLGLIVTALVACDKKSEIKVYRVSKAPLEESTSHQQNAMPTNEGSPQMPRGMAAANPQPALNAPHLTWEVPPGWTQIAPSAMRYASFTAGAANDTIDISIVTFLGEGGSDADNVNRWRGQMGLPPVDPEVVRAEVTELKSASASFLTTDIAGATTRTLAAWTRRDGRVWFFKGTGPSTAIEKEKPNFVKFVKSIRF